MSSFFFTKSINVSAEKIEDLIKSLLKLLFTYFHRIFSLLMNRLYNKLNLTLLYLS